MKTVESLYEEIVGGDASDGPTITTKDVAKVPKPLKPKKKEEEEYEDED